ncbi:lipopolysaccharide export system protein LptA [Nitrosomonas nitrosa]|uniref:lipopolysaccharide transport periplasmic protein LptA n=1 Tax=Nitrosomonas nitrosa TaxID=52442 RepID=UPI000D325620|nr:lipopolysaccharide transport periplasmic protein LptA [Nitrosomonas nitrosa]MCO6435202.1 lipopolysaccharide transport periplasmic protein LptA [Nitrosomonas nitrosa]PTQ93890.1 lipopolysaccharide export system protein LptA [Nitrosomonas nitrosa]
MNPFFFVLLVGSLFFSGLLLAERADRNKPIHLEADSATVEDYKRKDNFRQSIFTGNVILTQGTLVIRADKVILKEDLKGFRYATAYGDLVSFKQKRDGVDEYIEGWSQRVEYNDKTDKIELFGKARLKRGVDEVYGDYISYDIIRDFFQVTGGRKEKDIKEESGNRVRVIIQPKNKSTETVNTQE